MNIQANSAPHPPRPGNLRFVTDGENLKTLDPNGRLRTVQTTESLSVALDLYLPFDGEPANYVAEVPAVPMEGLYEPVGGKTLDLTARVAGVLDPAPTFELVHPGIPENPAPILNEVAETGVVSVSAATGIGDAAKHILLVGSGTGTKTITTTLTTAGQNGNAWYVHVDMPVTGIAEVFAITKPSEALSIVAADGGGGTEVSLYLATDAGTAGVAVLEEDVGSTPGKITITQQADYVGEWPPYSDDYTGMIVEMGSIGGSMSCAAVYENNTITITVTLGMTAGGVPDDAKNTATLIAAAINTALETVTDAGDLSDALLAEVAASGVFRSASNLVGMSVSSGGTAPVSAAAVVGGANQADEVAALIAGVTGVASSVVGAGAGNEEVPVTAISYFAGGGENSAITSTLADVAALLEVSEILSGVAGTGDGGQLCVATDSPIALTGGVDVIPSIPGTPARLGRIAIDSERVFAAMKEDVTEKQDGWVMIYPQAIVT